MQGFLLLAMFFSVYLFSKFQEYPEGEIRAIIFSALLLGNIFIILTNISKTRNIIFVITERNPVTIPILLTAIIMLLLIISIPSLRQTFNFEVTNYNHFMPSFLGAIAILIVLETIKYFKNRSRQNKESLV
ncbi:cation transporting ATPase C-terminal domain-containing protein [Flavobacterium sp. LB1P62]|uniref:cation transporting ATPase C-terminal domain-containing protein n=1 Tax=Flavobacterium sp. LB1P62 TaxID=3401715 RepID=UPI003AAADBB8